MEKVMKRCLPAFLAAVLFLVSCLPTQAQMTSLRTQIAGEVFETQTAFVPSATPLPPATAIPTATPEPTLTPTPLPAAMVQASNLNLREGPGTLYTSITQLGLNTELKVLGQFADCSWLKVSTTEGVEGWVKTGAGFVRFDGDCKVVPHGSFRPPTGTFIFDRRMAIGPGALTLQNSPGEDAVVVIADQVGAPFIAFYLREGENFTLTRIPDGSYLLYYVRGKEWDGDNLEFNNPTIYRRLDDLLAFSTTAGSPTNWSISLQPVSGGIGKSSEIQAKEFPALK